MNINPTEVRSYILGLEMAVMTAKRYMGVDMINFIGHIEELMESARNISGYREWLKGQGETMENKENEVSPLTKMRMMTVAGFPYPEPWQNYDRCVAFISFIAYSKIFPSEMVGRALEVLKEIGEDIKKIP